MSGGPAAYGSGWAQAAAAAAAQRQPAVVGSAELDELVVADAAALRGRLSANHNTSPGVWLALTRDGGKVTTLTWQQTVDEALCFGWIDGQTWKRDQETSWIRFTPRRPPSPPTRPPRPCSTSSPRPTASR